MNLRQSAGSILHGFCFSACSSSCPDFPPWKSPSHPFYYNDRMNPEQPRTLTLPQEQMLRSLTLLLVEGALIEALTPRQYFSGLPLFCPHGSYVAEEHLHSQLLLPSTRFQAHADSSEEQKPLDEGGKLLRLLLTRAAHQYSRGLSDSTQPCPLLSPGPAPLLLVQALKVI